MVATNSSPEKHAVCIEGLSVGYGEKVILRDLNFCVEHGQVVTVLGGSGSGKSTLLKAIIGLIPPREGHILLFGKDISGDRAEETLHDLRRRIGVLFQAGALIGSMTVAENIALPIREFSDVPDDIADDIVRLKLEMVRLEGFGNYYPSELSGGMKKRAGLARAVALDPQILFCDEPSSGLDPQTAAEMDRLLLEMNEALGITMIVITHDLPSIRTISDWSVMLDREAGGIIAMGPPEELEKSEDRKVSAFFHREPGAVPGQAPKGEA